MKLRTEISVINRDMTLQLNNHIFMTGSCFATNMGAKLEEHGFTVTMNPTGVLYNPLSISAMFERLSQQKPYELEDLFEHNGIWHSYDHHSSFSGTDSAKCLDKINASLEQGLNSLKSADMIYITLGSAYLFELVKDGRVVANCHKMHPSNFIRRRMALKETHDTLARTLDQISAINKDANIVFTVSPIRHIADGLHDNQLSKSTLLLAIDTLMNSSNAHKERIGYFPAYEILMDDLRDYRFYASDMLHPSDTAISYIWEKFCDTYMSQSTLEEAKRKRKEILKSRHRPIVDND